MVQTARNVECVASSTSERFFQRRSSPQQGRTMRVLIDARKIVDGGIGTHIQNLISGLSGLGTIEVHALTSTDRASVALQAGAVDCVEDSALSYSIDELLFLGKRIAWDRFDLFHTPHFVLPYGIPIPTIVTIHDVIQITHPERFFYPFVAKNLTRSALKRCNAALTVSETTKREVLRLFPFCEKKISVIPNAVDPFFISETFLREVPPDHSERGAYIVGTFSNLKPHKGLSVLLSVFRGLKARGRLLSADDPLKANIEALKLVLVGQGTEALKGEELDPDVLVAGRVSTRELHKLYSFAQALVVASTVEGFCLPVIEAQACATPVIARPTPAVVELMTTNDMLVPDFSERGFVDTLFAFFERRIRSPELVEYAVPLGHMRRFDREEIAERVAEFYARIVSLPS